MFSTGSPLIQSYRVDAVVSGFAVDISLAAVEPHIIMWTKRCRRGGGLSSSGSTLIQSYRVDAAVSGFAVDISLAAVEPHIIM